MTRLCTENGMRCKRMRGEFGQRGTGLGRQRVILAVRQHVEDVQRKPAGRCEGSTVGVTQAIASRMPALGRHGCAASTVGSTRSGRRMAGRWEVWFHKGALPGWLHVAGRYCASWAVGLISDQKESGDGRA